MAGLIDLLMKWAEQIAPLGFFNLATFCICTFLVVDMAKTQISPGELHQSHAFLEGLDNCNRCHDPKRDNMAENCLACHTVIKQQLLKSKGLHAQKEFAKCELCHVEHQGRTFQLVYFKDGTSSFQHSTTGYKLEGKHASLDCRNCHNNKNIQGVEDLKKQGVSIERTYLGLNRDCLSCHFDEHRGQLSKDCFNCHTYESWKPAPGFDHSRTVYPLTGRHEQVDCIKCHIQIVSGAGKDDKAYLTYASTKHNQCSDCHSDAHKGRLGLNCNQCHNTSGWGSVKMTNFDHSRTNYPLLGMHAQVACEKCHGDRITKGLKFADCRNCHKDFHKGEFANRASKGACEECHSVQGFLPSSFTMLNHEETLFPLTGAHRAIACIECHVNTSGKNSEYQFSFESLRCLECHQDPHNGQVSKFLNAGGCESCHQSQSWVSINFDHEKTNFPLEGAHIGVPCTKCHKSEVSGKNHFIRFKPVSTKCSTCHSGNVAGERLKG